MHYQCKTKKVNKVDCNGQKYQIVVDIPYDAANPDSESLGLRCGQQILFPDGSWREAYSGIRHQPPVDPQCPKEVWKNILTYYSVKSQNLSTQFDRLQNRLLECEDTFKVTLPDGQDVDALIHLQNLGSQITECEKMKKKCNEKLGRTIPEFQPPTYTKEELSEIGAKEKRVKEFRQAVVAVERPEITQDLRLTGTR